MTASSIIDQLVQQGVRHFCMAPGSRCTPLVQAATNLHVHFDERGTGFQALGMAKASGEPAAIIVTSGTAVGNLLPAVMEAHHSCIPLILLTADRPFELRDCGANQATDQVKLFGSFVRGQFDLPVSAEASAIRSTIAHAYFLSKQNPPGPVQINCQFREPFPEFIACKGKRIDLTFPKLIAEPKLTTHSKGLILIGKLPHPDEIHPILALAKRLQWPVFSDILSNGRCFPSSEQIRHFDWIEKPTPDLVLHFGERMTSKRVLQWLSKIGAELIHISPYPFLQDPERLVTARVQSDIAPFCERFQAPINPNWIKTWNDQPPQFKEGGPFTEAHAMRAISEMPLDRFWHLSR